MLETAIADYHAALQDEAIARATWEALTVGSVSATCSLAIVRLPR